MKIRDILEIDFFLLLSTLALIICGVMFIYSSNITSAGVLVSNEYLKQIIWGSAGLIIALALALINYRRVYNLSLYIYLITLLPLLYTSVFGRVMHGTRWLRIGSLGLQASEFAKIAVIILLARFLSDTKRGSNDLIRFVVSCVIVIVPMGIVLVQPDLGTALVFIPILISMTFIAGIPPRYIIFLLASMMLTGILMVLPLWQSAILQKSLPFL